jgi:hypothetical protein
MPPTNPQDRPSADDLCPHGAGEHDCCDECARDNEPCFHCGGDGYVECDDPIQCTSAHRNGLCPCASCGGTGKAKDMTIL